MEVIDVTGLVFSIFAMIGMIVLSVAFVKGYPKWMEYMEAVRREIKFRDLLKTASLYDSEEYKHLKSLGLIELAFIKHDANYHVYEKLFDDIDAYNNSEYLLSSTTTFIKLTSENNFFEKKGYYASCSKES